MTTVYLTDRDLRPVGDPIPWTEVDAVARFNEPGHCSVNCPARADVMAQLADPGRRAVLIHAGAVFMAGPVERPHGDYQWSAGGGEAAEPGAVTLHFTDDLALVAGRFTYPTPTAVATAQTATARYTQTAAAGTVIRDLVRLNAGPDALVLRRVPGLVMGAGAGLGSTVTWSTRFQPLGDEIREIAIAGGGLGFRTVPSLVAREVVFEVYATQDLSGSVRFTRGLGNLRSVVYGSEIPRITAAIVGGQDAGEDRQIVERVDATAASSWWRIETFIDRRDTDDTTEHEQAGDEALAEGGEATRLATVTVDTPAQRYGEHYQLGDRVATEPVPGIQVVDLVRAAHLQVTPRSGALLTAMVGSQAMARDPEWLRQSRLLARQLARAATANETPTGS